MSRFLRLTFMLLVLTLAGMVQAQDEPGFGLAPREARFFREAMQTTSGSTSFQVSLTGTLTVASGDENVRIVLNGGGTVLPQAPVGLDLTSAGQMEGIPNVPPQFKLELRLVNGMFYTRGTNLETGEVAG